MNRAEADAAAIATILLVIPVLVVWAFALFDIVRRTDIGGIRKLAYGAIVLLLFPATLLYLLSRPTSLVRHRDRRTATDWRGDLVQRLEAGPGPPPVIGPRQQAELVERVGRVVTR